MANFVKISLLSQPSLSHSPFSEDLEAKVQEMMAYLQKNLEQVLPDQPDLIVVPEACDRFPSFTMEQRKRYYQHRGDRIRDFYRQVARKNHCYIAYSACRWLPEETTLPYRNSTQIIGRDGEIVGIYDKNHLVPAELDNGEIAYGTEAPVFQLDFGRVGCAICFDLNFDELMRRYAEQKPDLLIFSSMYHGGLSQEYWAYSCRSYFAGAICNDQSRILNPFGETVASTTNYYNFITGKVNLDYALVHIDRNGPKYRAAKEKYGDRLIIHDPGHIGAVMLTYEGTDRTVKDIIREFDIMLLDDYFNNCRAHRVEHTAGR
jgi:hypothetical protein